MCYFTNGLNSKIQWQVYISQKFLEEVKGE